MGITELITSNPVPGGSNPTIIDPSSEHDKVKMCSSSFLELEFPDCTNARMINAQSLKESMEVFLVLSFVVNIVFVG
jgi:hypothetical protein